MTDRLALMAVAIGLYQAEVIDRRSPWHKLQAVEPATLGLLLKAAAVLAGLFRCCAKGVDWFNHRRLFQPMATYRLPRPKPRSIEPGCCTLSMRGNLGLVVCLARRRLFGASSSAWRVVRDWQRSSPTVTAHKSMSGERRWCP